LLKARSVEVRRTEDGEANMTIGDYPVSGKPYWLTMTGVAALGLVGVALMLSVM